MNRVWRCLHALLLVALLPGLALGDAPAAKPKPALPPIDLPQVRVDQLDVSAWPKVRVLATVLDKLGRPVELKGIKKLQVLDGRSGGGKKSSQALAAFQLGKAMDGRKDATLKSRDKVGLGLGLVFVVAGYADTVPSTTQERIKESLAVALKPLAKPDRANLIWYGDRLHQYLGLKSKTSGLSDLEHSRKDCALAREEARAMGPITLAGPGGKDDPPPAPGTDLCGLQPDPKTVAKAAKNQQFSGAFPRLFNLGAPFFSPTRYCRPPPGALDGFGEIIPENYNREVDEREVRKNKGEALDFTTSAFEEALRLVIRDGKPDELKAIVLISDGRDGYARDLQLCQEAPPAKCAAIDPKKKDEVKACLTDFLQKRVASQQLLFKSQAEHWIGVARAAGVRIFAVGIRSMGQPHELERLRLLAERTGGTYREAGTDEKIADEVARTMGEVTGQVAIEFQHQTPDELEPGKDFGVRLMVELDKALGRGDVLMSEAVAVAIPEPKTFRQEAELAVRSLAVRLQDLLGYQVYVIAGIAALALAGLFALLITFLILRKLFRRKPKAA